MNRTLLAALAALWLGALPAVAQDWSVTGRRGGTASGTIDCARAVGRLACTNDVSLTGSGGRSVSGTRESLRGPVRGRAVTTIARPDGGSVTRVVPLGRRDRRDLGLRGWRPGRW